MMLYWSRAGVMTYHGDVRDVLPRLPDGCADMIFMDPPYGHRQNDGDLAYRREEALGLVKRGTAIPGVARPIAGDSFNEASDLVRLLFAESPRLLKTGGCCCCCCGGGPDPQSARWSLWLDELLGFKQMVVWDKGGLGLGWHYRRNYEVVLVGEKPGGPCKWYGGTRSPTWSIFRGLSHREFMATTRRRSPRRSRRCSSGYTRCRGETVLDPFMGAGTTLRAAMDMGRRAVGIEIEERWCEAAAKRLAQRSLFEAVK